MPPHPVSALLSSELQSEQPHTSSTYEEMCVDQHQQQQPTAKVSKRKYDSSDEIQRKLNI